MIPRKECPREHLGDAFREELCLAYLGVCLWEFLMRWGICLELGASQKLSTTDVPFASFFSKLQGERLERIDLALA